MIKNIFLLEDCLETQHWLEQLLQRLFTEASIKAAASIAQAKAFLVHEPVDLALLDIGLPEGVGSDLISLIKTKNPQAICVMSTIFDSDDAVFYALEQGADGYILKDQTPLQIENLLNGIIAGQPALSPAIARKILSSFRQSESERYSLTERELDILRCIGKGFTVAKAAQINGISYRTAEGYVKNIYRKLNVSNRAEAAVIAARMKL